MTRASWKGPIITTEEIVGAGTMFSRNHVVMPSDIGKVVLIHNGRGLFKLTVNKFMLYKKLGTLAYTKKLCVFRSKKGKKKKK